jgi:hypothetical protein
VTPAGDREPARFFTLVREHHACVLRVQSSAVVRLVRIVSIDFWNNFANLE